MFLENHLESQSLIVISELCRFKVNINRLDC